MNDLKLLREVAYELQFKWAGNIDSYINHLEKQKEEVRQLNEDFGQITFEPFPTKYIERKIEILKNHRSLKEGRDKCPQ